MTKEELWQKLIRTVTSRKFWALVASLVTVAAGYATGDLAVWQAVTAVVAALAAYATGTAIEDGLRASKPQA